MEPIDWGRPPADSIQTPADAGEPVAKAVRRVTFAIPPNTAQAACRSCGAPGFWIETDHGRPLLVNPNGEAHFATCPDAKHWRRTRR